MRLLLIEWSLIHSQSSQQYIFPDAHHIHKDLVNEREVYSHLIVYLYQAVHHQT